MKLTAFFLLCICLQVSATGHSQEISISETNVPLKKVFKEIEKQSSYQFFYKDKLLRQTGNVTISVSKATVEEALQKCLANQPLTFMVVDKIILIKEKEKPAKVVNAEVREMPRIAAIKGTVKGEKGLPLSGVSVTVQGSQRGTTTNKDGEFFIDANPGEVLVFSFVGYKKTSVAVGSNPNLNIQLEIEAVSSSEVVVIGYGTKTRAQITGAISTVKMDDVLGNRPVSTTATLLQGAAPGLQVKIGSGEPGASANFNIRGITGLGTSGAPLILVDNVPFNGPLNLLDPNDIETVTVLKDAGSAAIYGGRSAFGVVLITTKKGTKNQKTEFNYSNNLTFASPQNLPEKPTPLQTIQTYKDMGTVGYWSGQNVDTWLQLMNDYQANPSKYPGGYAYVGTQRYPLAQTDVMKDLLGNTSFQQMHNFSVNGGTEKTNYRLSAGLTDEKGILAPKANSDNYKRYNVRSFISTDVATWFTTQADISYFNSSKTYPNNDNQFGQAVNLPSYVSTQDTITASNGQMGVNGTPKNLIGLSSPTTTVNNDIRITGRAILRPIKDLTITADYTVDNLWSKVNAYDKPITYVNASNFQYTSNAGSGVYGVTNQSSGYKALNIFGNYRKSFHSHNLSLVLGYNQESNNITQNYVQRDGLIAANQPSLSTATGSNFAMTDAISQYALRGFFGRISYDYKGKYLAEINGRYDGSSKFPESNRWVFTPSALLGWRVTEEKFMRGLKPVLSDLKLKASIGRVGNQNIDPYAFVPTMSPYNPLWLNGSSALLTSLSTPGLISSNFTWETVQTINAGLEFGLFKNHFTGTFELYQRETKNILAPGATPLPAVLGAPAPLQNTASVTTKGFELQLNYQDWIGKVHYRIGANIFDFQDSVTKFDGNPTGLLSTYYVGQKTGEIWGYVSDRFYTTDDFVAGSLDANQKNGTLKPGVVAVAGQRPNPGDMKFVDLNKDQVINTGSGTLSDPGDMKVIGNNAPRYQFDVRGGVSWKNFDFSFILTGVGKQDLWLSNVLTFPNQYAFGTVYAHELNYWTPTNTNAFYARIYDQASGNQASNQRVQTKYLLNGAYLKVKNLSLSYSIPQALLKKIHVNRLQVFYSIENPITFDHLAKGLDPTVDAKQYGMGYPFLRMSSTGISLSF